MNSISVFISNSSTIKVMKLISALVIMHSYKEVIVQIIFTPAIDKDRKTRLVMRYDGYQRVKLSFPSNLGARKLLKGIVLDIKRNFSDKIALRVKG